jgi:hypothetical protein
VSVTLLVILIMGVVALYEAGMQSRIDSFRAQCTQREGHPYGTGLVLCLTSDGRIIEVYP